MAVSLIAAYNASSSYFFLCRFSCIIVCRFIFLFCYLIISGKKKLKTTVTIFYEIAMCLSVYIIISLKLSYISSLYNAMRLRIKHQNAFSTTMALP